MDICHLFDLANQHFGDLYRVQLEHDDTACMYEAEAYQDSAGLPKARIFQHWPCSGITEIFAEDLSYAEALTIANNKLNATI